MPEISISVEENFYAKLQEMAQRNKLSLRKLCQLILQEFTGDGNVYSGVWESGPGRRIIIDWPKFSSRVIKLKFEEME